MPITRRAAHWAQSIALGRPVCAAIIQQQPQYVRRTFHQSPLRFTDGVFHELTASRIRTPWIEALRESQNGNAGSESIARARENRDLTPKKMADSYYRIVLPLARDPWLLDTYANASGHIRLGALLMDLDALSGVIAYKHTGESVTIVTAAVDRITIKHPLQEICDLELSGQVTFATGRSSLEVSLQVAKVPAENQEPRDEDVLMTCTFTMVSLDPTTKKPVPIAPLKIETDKERELFQKGEENYNAKKKLAKSQILDHKPNDEESGLIHEMWKKRLSYSDTNDPAKQPINLLPMDRTIIHSTQIMQPQFRNRHNFMIFGGFLMKATFELAFTCAAAFSHTRPSFLSLDPSTFENPVPVGSVLYITASVNYTDPSPAEGGGTEQSNSTRVQVTVVTKVRNVEHEERKPAGIFYYTFLVNKDVRVMPETYSEFMRWIDGRRRARRVAASLETKRSIDTARDQVTE